MICGGRFSKVTHPYTYKTYRCSCVGSECLYGQMSSRTEFQVQIMF